MLISAVAETEPVMDLNSLRKKLADFIERFNAINCWDEPSISDGTKTVEEMAKDIIASNDAILARNSESMNLWKQLNFVASSIKSEIPLLERDINALNISISGIKTEISELEKDFSDKRSKLDNEKGGLDRFFKELNQKKKKYKRENIEGKEALFNQESKFISQKDNLQNTLAAHETKYNDISLGYKHKYKSYELMKASFEQKKNETLIERKNTLAAELEQSRNNNQTAVKELEDSYEGWLKESDSRMDLYNSEISRLENDIKNLDSKNLKKKKKRESITK